MESPLFCRVVCYSGEAFLRNVCSPQDKARLRDWCRAVGARTQTDFVLSYWIFGLRVTADLVETGIRGLTVSKSPYWIQIKPIRTTIHFTTQFLWRIPFHSLWGKEFTGWLWKTAWARSRIHRFSSHTSPLLKSCEGSDKGATAVISDETLGW